MNKWEKLYHAVVEENKRMDGEIKSLQQILQMQVRSNDRAGERMAQQDSIMQGEIGDHNSEMQRLAERVVELSEQVVMLGGTP